MIKPATKLPTALRGPWSTAASGARFHPLDLRPDEVHIGDIAHALARLSREAGPFIRSGESLRG